MNKHARRGSAMAERRYPRGIMGISPQGHRSLTIWEKEGAGARGVHKLLWENLGTGEVTLSTMTDPGTYWISNWDNSQGGEPSQWEEVERFPAPTARDADRVMREVARERFNVAEIV